MRKSLGTRLSRKERCADQAQGEDCLREKTAYFAGFERVPQTSGGRL